MANWMIYGAYGYSGRQILEAAVRGGLSPIAAGRDPNQTTAVAGALGVEARSFSLDDPVAMARALRGVSLVMHCAGPYSSTARSMLDACIRAGAHYLGLTGEYKVIEAVAARDAELRRAGVMAMCAVGMDVVPTDCLAAHIKRRMPAAVRLDLYIRALEKLSPGTAATMVEGAGLPNVVRVNGVLVEAPAGADRRVLRFPDAAVRMVGLPWGDVATAWRTTGIPNIAVHMSLMKGAPMAIALGRHFRWLTQIPRAQRILKRMVRRFVQGPDETYRSHNRCEFIAEATDPAGRKCSTYLRTPEVYAFTAASATLVCERVLTGQGRAGFQTPGGLFGPDFVLQIPGSERRDLE